MRDAKCITNAMTRCYANTDPCESVRIRKGSQECAQIGAFRRAAATGCNVRCGSARTATGPAPRTRHGERSPGGAVRVSTRRGSDGGVTVCVRDEGGSIPPEAVPHLFGRFYRVDSSRAQATGGTGLGLAIAKQAALRHGGDIDVESSPEVGTRVSVRLPSAD
jgi:hypothetical protein